MHGTALDGANCLESAGLLGEGKQRDVGQDVGLSVDLESLSASNKGL